MPNIPSRATFSLSNRNIVRQLQTKMPLTYNIGTRMNEKLTQTKLRIVTRCPELQKLLKLHRLDKITLFKAEKLLQAILDNRHPKPDSCLVNHGISATTIYHIGPSCGNRSEHSTLNLNNVCDIQICKCDPNFSIAGTTRPIRRMHCFCQLATGKCTDQYMQNTLGKVLFPSKYNKQK